MLLPCRLRSHDWCVQASWDGPRWFRQFRFSWSLSYRFRRLFSTQEPSHHYEVECKIFLLACGLISPTFDSRKLFLYVQHLWLSSFDICLAAVDEQSSVLSRNERTPQTPSNYTLNAIALELPNWGLLSVRGQDRLQVGSSLRSIKSVTTC